MDKSLIRTGMACVTLIFIALVGLDAYDKYLTTQTKKDCNAQHQ